MASATGRTSADAVASPPSPEKARSPAPATVTARCRSPAGRDVNANASPTTSALRATAAMAAMVSRREARGRALLGAGNSAGTTAGGALAGQPAATQGGV